MLFASFLCKSDLFLTLAEAGLVILGGFVRTVVAGDSFFEFGPLRVFGKNGTAARVAKVVGTFGKPVPHGNATVKDKTFTVPEAVFLRHFLEVFQNTTLEVIHLFDTLLAQEVGRFFTADAAGAKHRDAFIVKAIFVLFPPLGKFTELLGLWVYGPFKGADAHFVIVAGINDHNIGCRNQGVPILRFDVMSNACFWIDIGLAHCHDFFF